LSTENKTVDIKYITIKKVCELIATNKLVFANDEACILIICMAFILLSINQERISEIYKTV
jgi:hypothetical protein